MLYNVKRFISCLMAFTFLDLAHHTLVGELKWGDFLKHAADFSFQRSPLIPMRAHHLPEAHENFILGTVSLLFPLWESRGSFKMMQLFSPGFLNKSQTWSDDLSLFPFSLLSSASHFLWLGRKHKPKSESLLSRVWSVWCTVAYNTPWFLHTLCKQR